ncbi:MAG TPA: hypothetical protein VJ783_26875, partial [Pirellulales bacterium]|nr:hypothetical protein [Pirellulales bacterium]
SIVDRATELVHDHWLKVAAWGAALAFSSLWAFFWAWRSWRNRQDMDVIHVSQNTIVSRPTGDKGAEELWLILDVHFEDPLEQVISHPMPRQLIRRAAKRTTENQPFLVFSNRDRWYILNLIRLAIAEPFRVGTAAKMIRDANVAEVECVFALTYERYKGMRQGKIRVMLIPRAVLDDPKSLDRPLRLEAESHRDRITTLKAMQRDWLKAKESQFCMNVRLNVPL